MISTSAGSGRSEDRHRQGRGELKKLAEIIFKKGLNWGNSEKRPF